jgi:hypothetical protein
MQRSFEGSNRRDRRWCFEYEVAGVRLQLGRPAFQVHWLSCVERQEVILANDRAELVRTMRVSDGYKNKQDESAGTPHVCQ